MERTSPVLYRVAVCLVVVHLVLFYKLSIAFQAALGIALAPLLVERLLHVAGRVRQLTPVRT